MVIKDGGVDAVEGWIAKKQFDDAKRQPRISYGFIIQNRGLEHLDGSDSWAINKFLLRFPRIFCILSCKNKLISLQGREVVGFGEVKTLTELAKVPLLVGHYVQIFAVLGSEKVNDVLLNDFFQLLILLLDGVYV